MGDRIHDDHDSRVIGAAPQSARERAFGTRRAIESNITFAPASVGSFSQTALIRTDDPSAPAIAVSITGIGV